MNHYVYEITNLINGKKYIGKRSCKCAIEDDKYMGSGKYLKNAFKKYGKYNFRKEVLEVCNCEEDAFNKEIYYIEQVKAYQNNNYYNIASGGGGGNGWTSGKSDDELQKIYEKLATKNRIRTQSSDFRNNMKIKNKKYWEDNYDLKRKASESMKIKWASDRDQMLSNLNKYWSSDDCKKKSSNASILRWQSENYRNKIISSQKKAYRNSVERQNSIKNLNTFQIGENHPMYGKCHSELSKKKMSIAKIGKIMTSETKLKLSKKMMQIRPNKKSVICLNTRRVYEAIIDAERETGISVSNIVSCCSKKTKTAGKINGFPVTWMYYEDFIQLNEQGILEIINNSTNRDHIILNAKSNIKHAIESKKVKVILLNTREIFDSMIDASLKTGISHQSNISACCRGKRKSSGKINGEPAKWMYYDDYLNTIKE